MISGSQAAQLSNTVTGSLSYITNLITGATDQGLYQVWVSNRYINDTMMNQLIKTYRYNVTKRYSDMGTNADYLIDWTPQTSTQLGQSAIFISSDVDGGARWFFGLLDFKNVTPVGLIDTSLNISDYYIYDVYPLQNNGYMVIFYPQTGDTTQVFFIASDGTIVEQYSGSTNFNYNLLDGKWCYFEDNGNGVVKAFNGTLIYTLNYDPGYQDFYIDFDWDGATNNGSFQYTLYDDNSVTDSIVIVRPDATSIEIENLDVTAYYHDCFIYMDSICLLTYESGSGNVVSLKYYDYLGNLVKTINTSSYSLQSWSFRGFSDSKTSIVLYDGGDVNVNYRVITYDFNNDILINESVTRGSEYESFNTYYDAKGVYQENYIETENIYYMFYGNSNSTDLGFYEFDYCKFYYIEDGDVSGNTYTFIDDGSYTKSIQLYSIQTCIKLMMPINNGDGNLKFLIIDKNGNKIVNPNISLSDLNDCGWSNSFGKYYKYVTEDNTLYQYVCHIFDSTGDLYYHSDPLVYNNINTYYNILLINSDSDVYYYFNETTTGVTFLSSGITMNTYNPNWYYNSDNIMREKLVLHYPTINQCYVLKSNSLSSVINLSTNTGTYDIEVMKDFFVYLYMDSGTNNLTAKAYKFTGTLVNTLNTNISQFADEIQSAENRFWFSQYTDTNMLTYYAFNTTDNFSVTLSNENTDYQYMDDYIWWD
jgi:hypothetical protein